jgi:hypothetical protein
VQFLLGLFLFYFLFGFVVVFLMDTVGFNKVMTNKNNNILEIKQCYYCGSSRPIEELENQIIWVNGTTREELFCKDKHCANYAQMGAEG